jgi:hypothetical protein
MTKTTKTTKVMDIQDYINEPILTPQKDKIVSNVQDIAKAMNELLDKNFTYWKSLGFKELKRYEVGRELLVSGDKNEYKWILTETKEGYKKLLLYRLCSYKKKDNSGYGKMMSLRTTYYDTTSKTEYDVWNMLTNKSMPIQASIRQKVEA